MVSYCGIGGYIMEDKKSPRFRLFDWNKDGKGVSKTDSLEPTGLKRFFVLYKDNFSKLVSINMFMVLGNFPALFAIAALSGFTQIDQFLPMSDLFQNLFGVTFSSDSLTPAALSAYAVLGLSRQTLVPTTATYIFFAISALTLLTFGPVNVGTAYLYRNLLMSEPVFPWRDFFYSVRKNFKQGLIYGIIDLCVIGILGFNIYSLLTSGGDFFKSVLFYGNVVLFIFYFCVRFSIYLQIVTFDLSLKKIFKNAVIFAILGFKRNVLALLGIAVLLFFEIAFIGTAGGFLVPLAVAAPLLILFSTFAYIKVYAAYGKIHQYMIVPYLEEHPKTVSDVEPIMKDEI